MTVFLIESVEQDGNIKPEQLKSLNYLECVLKVKRMVCKAKHVYKTAKLITILETLTTNCTDKNNKIRFMKLKFVSNTFLAALKQDIMKRPI